MTKAVDLFQNKISKIINNTKVDIEPPSTEDLIATIASDQQFWSEFRIELKRNNIGTNEVSSETTMKNEENVYFCNNNISL